MKTSLTQGSKNNNIPVTPIALRAESPKEKSSKRSVTPVNNTSLQVQVQPKNLSKSVPKVNIASQSSEGGNKPRASLRMSLARDQKMSDKPKVSSQIPHKNSQTSSRNKAYHESHQWEVSG